MQPTAPDPVRRYRDPHHGLQEVRLEDLADEAYKDRIIAALKEEPDVV